MKKELKPSLWKPYHYEALRLIDEQIEELEELLKSLNKVREAIIYDD